MVRTTTTVMMLPDDLMQHTKTSAAPHGTTMTTPIGDGLRARKDRH
jgi:hypothetical protein